MKMTLLSGAFAVLAFVSGAEEWSGTKAYEDDATVSEGIVLTGPTVVEVAAGKTVALSGVVSGGAGCTLAKTGGGNLVLSNANTFVAGVIVSNGAVTVANDDALGTGAATVLGQLAATGLCELRFNSGSKDVCLTVTNAINFIGNTTKDYPGLVFYYQKTTLSGPISAVEDLIFYDDYPSQTTIHERHWDRYKNVLSATFNAPITVGGTVGSMGLPRYMFNAAVTAEEISANIARPIRPGDTQSFINNSNAHMTFDFLVPCTVKRVTSGYSTYIYMGCANAFPGAILTGVTGGGTSGTPFFHSKSYAGTGYDESIGGLESPTWSDGFKKPDLRFDASKTLTITGVAPEPGETTRELSSSIILTNDAKSSSLSLTLDAPASFTQTISGRSHGFTGAVTVKSGTLKLTGTARFYRTSGLTVKAAGVFDASAATEGDFLPTNGTLALTLETGATFKLPASCTALKVKTLTLDGLTLPANTVVTSANFPSLPAGLTVTTVQGTDFPPPAATTSASWLGSDDRVMTTMANWEGTPTSLDLANGTLGVTVKACGAMTYPNGTRINKISWSGLTTNDCVTLQPQNPGDVLFVDRSIVNSSRKAQLVLRGCIAPPFHIDQGQLTSDTIDTDMALSYSAVTVPKGFKPTGGAWPYDGGSGKYSLPLLLDGVTLEKPLLVKAINLGTCCLYANPNTTNVLAGHVRIPQPWAYLTAAEGSRIELAGGVTCTWSHRLRGPGTWLVREKPITSTTFIRMQKNVRLELDVEGCTLLGSDAGDGLINESGTVAFKRSWCLKKDGDLSLRFESTGTTCAEFNATTQRVGIASFVNSNAQSELRGDYPAMLEMTGECHAGCQSFYPQTNCVQVTGGLGFHTVGTNACFALGAKAYESCGDLIASAGTLLLKNGATWLNGTNFVANGTGTLAFDGHQPVSREWARLAVADEGKVLLAADSSVLKVAAATVDGEPVKPGRYAAGDGSALGAHLERGSVVVGKLGMVLVVR